MLNGFVGAEEGLERDAATCDVRLEHAPQTAAANTTPPTSSRGMAGLWAGWALTVALYAAGMALMFRFAWLPGPSASIGDTADGMILTATLEHWFRVFTGRAADWLSPGWFWPATGTLGLTDTYFLIALPYGVVRALGFGPFGSYTASVAVLATTGFWGLVGLTRRCGVPAAIAGAMAFVFAFGALPTFKLHHGQTYTVMLAPILGLLLHSAWRSRKGAATAAWAGAAGVMYGLMTLTAPQTAWFLGFSAGLAGIALLLLTVPFGVLPVSRKREELLQKTVTIAAGGALGLAVGFVPVLLVYSSALAGRRRFWADVLSFSPRFTDLLNVQPGNLLWEGPLRLAGITDIPGRSVSEMALGFTPVLALSALVALLLLGRARRLAGPHPWDLPARAFLAAAFMGWLITVNYGAVAPWRLVFDYVPGASGIRTPFRIQLASFFFLCFGLAHAAARAMAVAAARSSPGLAAAIGAVLALCVVEQAGPTTTVRNTRELARWLVASHRPSFPCEAFYVLPLSKPSYLQWFEQESDAMMLSQWIGMPTLNGNSSWMPRGYEMVHIDWPNYAANKLAWIDAHDLRDRVCGVEPRAGRWEPGVGPLLRAAGR